MKHQHFFSIACAITLGVTCVCSQTVVTETTTSAMGTISTVAPTSIVVRTETSTTPMRYTFTKTTEYVDESGLPVSLEMLKSGLPVTVHYVKQGEHLQANKVVIRRTETTTTAGAAPPATLSSTEGMVSEFSPGVLMVRTGQDSAPLRYTYTKTTQYVDETGAPVTIEVVKTGLPVKVYFAKEGDQLIAQRVVVRKATTVQPAPIIEERTTTTTTEVPVKRDPDDDDDD